MKTLLVFGGCGYIGSHVVLNILLNTEYRVVVFDDLSTGHEQVLPTIARVVSNKDSEPLVLNDLVKSWMDNRLIFCNGNIKNEVDLENVFTIGNTLNLNITFEGVFHLCAKIVVPESVTNPLAYYDNNFVGTLKIVQAMEKFKVNNFVFSSTAAIFGVPDEKNFTTNEIYGIPEDAPTIPINPYGETKLQVEKMLSWYSKSTKGTFKSVCLRYFNASGAHSSGLIGENHEPETHLIPIVLDVALGKRKSIMVFGNDYDTYDGTCVRDYVHVMDLASAHIKSLEYLQSGGESDCFNLGGCCGYSVKQVIECCKSVTNRDIPVVISERRLGDPAILVASSSKAAKVLGWKTQYSDLSGIVQSAWKYHQNKFRD